MQLKRLVAIAIIAISIYACKEDKTAEENYKKDSLRYKEMRKLYENLMKQLKSQVTTEGNEIIKLPIEPHYTKEELKAISLRTPNDLDLGALIRSKVQ